MLFKTVMLASQSDTAIDGKLFNLERLQAKSKVQTDVLDELLYADDMAKNAKTEKKMKEAMDRVSKACDNLGSPTVRQPSQ